MGKRRAIQPISKLQLSLLQSFMPLEISLLLVYYCFRDLQACHILDMVPLSFHHTRKQSPCLLQCIIVMLAQCSLVQIKESVTIYFFFILCPHPTRALIVLCHCSTWHLASIWLVFRIGFCLPFLFLIPIHSIRLLCFQRAPLKGLGQLWFTLMLNSQLWVTASLNNVPSLPFPAASPLPLSQ